MKTLKKIGLIALGIVIYVLLFFAYCIDRIITSWLFWIELQPITLWFPKPTKLEQVKAEFPTLSTEALTGLIQTRLKSRQYVKESLFRLGLYTLIGIAIFVINLFL